ncbi:MAG: type III-B CRISPR module RAMP protein Cmr6 [Dysgonamonadaceae bacterium]|jgi:CRISPR-associated protein Cmr6|nr:type III-B CRISPR module RAMP protein Cmr6 [Dysgonamonadaceae bacterium]
MKNISWLFYKEYFQEIDFSGIKDINKDIKNKELIKSRNLKITNAELCKIDNPVANQRVQMQIEYPGLATGIGINHEASVEGEFKLGMHFDYTYGMPVIHGSSVKGLLRNAFPENEIKEKERETEAEKENRIRKNRIRICKIDQIREYLEKVSEDLDIDKLRDEIFESVGSIYNRDIFYDAVIVKSNKKNKILASDSITPHKNPLQEPNPITFLKIASGVTIEFRFDLKDGIISAEEKCNIFKRILLDYGVGAKTNVGYGQLT